MILTGKKERGNVKLEDFRCKCMNERIDNRPDFIIGGRRSGKTVSLIKEVSKTNGIIVCPTRNMVNGVFQTACELGYNISMPITNDQLFAYSHHTNKNYHYFDGYGMTLIYALRRQLDMFDRHNTKSIIIDEESIASLNDILGSLKVRDMTGGKLNFKIEVLERNESDD